VAARVAQALLLAALLAPSASAQTPGQTRGHDDLPQNQGSVPPSSFRLDSISFSTGYYSSGFDPAVASVSNGSALGTDVSIGGAATIRWERPRERSDVYMTYTGDYSGHIRYSGWRSLNHRFSLNVNRRLSRWDFRFSLAANSTTMDQLLFTPNTLSEVATVPATFDDLTTSIMRGTFRNRALAPVLTTAQPVTSPTLLFYGSRTLSAAAQATISTRLTSRTTFQINAGATHSQGLPFNTPGLPEVTGSTSLFHATTLNVGVGISHSLSPRTEVAVNFTTSRTISRLQDTLYNIGSVSLTRTLSERWFASVHGGGGNRDSIRQTNTPQALQYQAGAGLGFKTFAHTLLGSYDRSFADPYGLGASATISSMGAWNYGRPDSVWRFRVSVGQQQVQSASFRTLESWQATMILQRALSTHTAIAAQYGYMRYSGGPSTTTDAISPSAVRLTVIWAPGLGLLP
jgi:hypothetical protein